MPNPLKPSAPRLGRHRTSPRDRYDAGRALRDSVPLEAHAEVPIGSARTEPLATLARQDQLRLDSLVPLRYGRMSRTPFTFLRGAAAVMASDLATMPSTELMVELCGDAHLGNFRWFMSPDRRLVFDLSDFDETLPGPFEWDLKRLATSVVVAARNNAFKRKECRAAVRATVQTYVETIGQASKLSPLELFYARLESEDVLTSIRRFGKSHGKWQKSVLGKAARKNSLRAFKKLTAVDEGKRVIVPDPPLVVRMEEELDGALARTRTVLKDYRDSLRREASVLLDQFAIVDVAHKVVGVGSVGTRCFIVLLEADDGTPLFLQLKEAVASVLEPYLGASAFGHAGQRVVEGQRLIQATSDSLLGWTTSLDDNIEFYVRQLWDGKGKIEVEDLWPERLALFGALCGKTLGLAHARSGDAMMVNGYIGDSKAFEKALVVFAESYADLTEQDHALLDDAVESGAIPVVLDL